MDIFVGNLTFKATEADVRNAFEVYGSVASVKIVTEKNTAKSRGFGFVRMPDEQQAHVAIQALNNTELMGRPINVSPARSKPAAPREKEEVKATVPKIKTAGRQFFPGEKQEETRDTPAVERKGGYKGGYKGGRRTLRYMKRLAGIEGAARLAPYRRKPVRKREENAKRWRKIEGRSEPWMKKETRSSPWQKGAGESKPRQRREGAPKPWQKTEGGPKFWQKRGSGFRSRHKSGGGSRPRQETAARSQVERFTNKKRAGFQKESVVPGGSG